MTNYPENTTCVLKLEKLYVSSDSLKLSDRLSTRMTSCAAVLFDQSFIGWQMNVPVKGLADITVFGSSDICGSDLEWITENIGKFKASSPTAGELTLSEDSRLYSLSLNVRNGSHSGSMGFTTAVPKAVNNRSTSWPLHYSSQFNELVKALKITGGMFRCVIGNANHANSFKEFISTWRSSSISAEDYFGNPVSLSLLLILPEAPTLRLKSILEEAVPGIDLVELGPVCDETCRQIWDNPLSNAKAYPNYAARILTMEPISFSDESIPGIEFCERETTPIYASHNNPHSKTAITIGKAIKSSGETIPVRLDDTGMKMHWDLVGMSGTGKTSLLTQAVISAIKTNHGCTVIDPHGNLVDSILERIPAEHKDRIRVVRIGNADKNPVPIRLFNSDNFRDQKVETEINNYTSMFQAIYDPKSQGFVGPRWIRLYTILTQTSLALGLGGTFQSIITMAQTKDNAYKALDAIRKLHNEDYRDLYEAVRNDLVYDKSDDYQSVISWFLSKFQQLVSTAQLRNTFGLPGGANALDFTETVDSDAITLIDLSSPVFGNDAARLTGMIIINKLWNALLTRQNREKNHLIVIDEAHLFSAGSNTLERMVYEGRKFGMSLLTAHQNYTQIPAQFKEAMASMTNFSCFRLSVKDSLEAAVKFDNPAFASKLCHLDNFNAITTLSVDGHQTSPFTLKVPKPRKAGQSAETVKYIENNSYRILVEPYKELKALSTNDILAHLDSIISTGRIPRFASVSKAQRSSDRNAGGSANAGGATASAVKSGTVTNYSDASSQPAPEHSSYLDDWLNKDAKPRRKVS